MKRLAQDKATELLKVSRIAALVPWTAAHTLPLQSRSPRLPSATFIKAYLEAFRPRESYFGRCDD
jgi:hypothetical protein